MRRRSSTNDIGKNHPYLKGIPEVEWEKATIKRTKQKDGSEIVLVYRNGIITYCSTNHLNLKP